jgi:hypothetical protein
MLEPMTVWNDVWGISGDETGLYLLDIGPWQPGMYVTAYTEPAADVRQELCDRGVYIPESEDGTQPEMVPAVRRGRLAYLHNTSNRVDGPRLVLTHIAVIDCEGDLVLDAFPQALGIDLNVFELFGPPPTHASTDVPTPRDIDTFFHGLGHLIDQINRNGTARRDIPRTVQELLAPMAATLGGMFQRPHPKAA